jgi:hypothetical protein
VLAAHERVVRGEDVSQRLPDGPDVIELPAQLAAWEPRYALAEYHAHRADFPTPDLPRLEPVQLPDGAPRVAPDEGVAALLETTRVWTQESNGSSAAVLVDGEALGAVASLGLPSARCASLTASDALAHLAWAASSGGAHGRRPGAAAGRFGAWWVAGALTGLLDPWPPDPEQLGEAITTLRWYAWDAGEPTTGWRLQLAVEHPDSGRSWAIAAMDAT